MLWWNNRRRRYLKKTDSLLMKTFLNNSEIDKKQIAFDTEYLAVDLEMSGLNKNTDQIISIGFVPIKQGQILIKHAKHIIIKHEEIELGNSVAIHGIHETELANGVSYEQAMQSLLSALSGRVLVLHNAKLDLGFLNKLSKNLYGVPIMITVLDTMHIERNRVIRQHNTDNLSLRLDDCRQRYNLPRYGAHNAAIDALATAELLLAQITHIDPNHSLKLEYFLRLS